MSATSPALTSRRRLLAVALAGLGVSAAALIAYEARLLVGQRYAATPFDDLISQLPERENAARLGTAVLAQEKSFDARSAALQLRARIKNSPLADVLATDLRSGHLTEVRGWILPETLAALCALSAKAA